MQNLYTCDAGRIQSLLDLNPLNPCTDCTKVTCTCDKPKRRGQSKNAITAEVEILREKKRLKALQGLQRAFKEDLPLCRFN